MFNRGSYFKLEFKKTSCPRMFSSFWINFETNITKEPFSAAAPREQECRNAANTIDTNSMVDIGG